MRGIQVSISIYRMLGPRDARRRGARVPLQPGRCGRRRGRVDGDGAGHVPALSCAPPENFESGPRGPMQGLGAPPVPGAVGPRADRREEAISGGAGLAGAAVSSS